MKLDRNISIIDAETTGVDVQVDKILELAVILWDGEKVISERVRRFNPGRPISAESTAIHGITDADVAAEPPFTAQIGKGLLQLIAGTDLAGYNLKSLDIPILDEELRRVGLKLDLTGVAILDAFGLYKKKNPRTLADYVRRYCHREPVGSHSALVDTQETLAGLLGQLAEHEDLAAMSLKELAAYSQMNEFDIVDAAGKLYRDKEGWVCYAFGQQRGVRVADNMSYASWMLNRANFPGSTCEGLLAELKRLEEMDVDPRAIGAGWEKG